MLGDLKREIGLRRPGKQLVGEPVGFLGALAALVPPAAFELFCLGSAYILFWLAAVPRGAVREYNRVGDYSYGMYVWAFPLHQSIIAVWRDLPIFQSTMLAFVATLSVAVVSWHLVEKPALKLRHRFAAPAPARAPVGVPVP